MHTTRPLLTLLLLGVAVTATGQEPATPANRLAVDIFALMDRLAVEMNKEFVIDPRLRGLQGFSTKGEDADYDTLLAILRSNTFAAIEVGDQIRIVSEATARSEPSPIVQEDDPSISDHAVVTRVIDVADIRVPEVSSESGVPATAAAYLVPVLRPLMSTSIGNATAIPGSDKMIITDRYDNVRRITAIVDELRQ